MGRERTFDAHVCTGEYGTLVENLGHRHTPFQLLRQLGIQPDITRMSSLKEAYCVATSTEVMIGKE
jgi:hypothetical protein